nr:ribonuclease H-like domain-containing protein [Tanacetum cinerariifolium]
MFVHGYTDDDEFVPNNPTLISKLDISDLVHLHPNDSATLTFIKGLDECYMQIRSNILSIDVSLDVRGAYAIISSEESHRVVSCFSSGTFQRPFNVTRPSSSRNKRPAGGSPLVCENCGFNGHTIDRCFKIIWYPPDFGNKNGSNNNTQNGQNFSKRFVNNNSIVSSSSSSFSFSDEQISKLIYLIKENSGNTVGKGVHDNMTAGLIVDSGANQHLIYSDKFLVNVIDISKFGIKVSHPNGTGALITKVGNMVLTKDITLYDVLVVSEYYTDNNSIPISDDNQGLNHVNFFNEVDVVDPGVSYDNFNNTSSQSDGSNHLHSVNPTFVHGTNGFAD